MKQVQERGLEQTLALTQVMRTSLNILRMEPGALIGLIDREHRRNPYLAVTNGDRFTGADATAAVPKEETRADDLLRQIGVLRLSPGERARAVELVHCLNEHGYLADGPNEICRYLDVGRQELLALVEKLQSLEPAGVFAWSLADSFRLQLIAKNRYDPLIAKLLERLDLVAQEDVDGICGLVGVDREDAVDMVTDIRSLSPNPYMDKSIRFDCEPGPELIFAARDAASFVASLNSDALPNLLTDDGLFQIDTSVPLDSSTRAYYRDCHRRAADLVMALQKRANTLLAIGAQIAERQSDFLRSGKPIDRTPLSRYDVARALGLNKSTVSRAVRGCLALTPFGVVGLEAFFVSPVNRQAETRTRAQALKRLQLIVKTEDDRAPLSDAAIVELMSRFGFGLSRRCIAKYRGLLSIPHSYQRRQDS